MASFENSFLEFVYYTYKSLKKKISSKFFLTTTMYENQEDICNSIVTPLFFDRLSFRTSASRRLRTFFDPTVHASRLLYSVITLFT